MTKHQGPASTEMLWALHRIVATTLLDAMQGTQPPKASLIDCARKFLRDNGVKASTLMTTRDGLERLSGLVVPFPAKGGLS